VEAEFKTRAMLSLWAKSPGVESNQRDTIITRIARKSTMQFSESGYHELVNLSGDKKLGGRRLRLRVLPQLKKKISSRG